MLTEIHPYRKNLYLDIRYATSKNFMNYALYSVPACFVVPEVKEALERVLDILEEKALGLKVYDGYRPLHVQKMMWDKIQDERYVSNPATNCVRHPKGTAVDVTLVDKQGLELEMPTQFDDFTERAHSDYGDLPAQVLANRQLLKEVMEQQGFLQLPTEWWHFDYRGWECHEAYPPLDFSLESLLTDKVP